jgi:pimeloyl-ACP methyl ester carboxylesterase
MTTKRDLLATLLVLIAPAAAHLDAQEDRDVEDGRQAGGARLELASVSIPLPGGKTATAERGMLRVPIVRADPASKVIGIDVWRFRALEGAPEGAPPIFRLYGGPGWPGLEPAGIDWEGDIVPFIRTADLVLVGQRGIGTSTDTSCDAVVVEGARPALDASREERAQYLRQKCGECRAHWESQGYDLRGLNVKEAAADVDDVRRLLGYEKIALWGGSFGSHWGMTVLRYHPQAVARAVLTGMEGPDHTYDMPSGVLHSLERMAKAAERAPELAAHIPEEGLLGAFALVVESAEEEPFEIEVVHPRTGKTTSVPFDGAAVRNLALGYSGRVSSRGGMPGWPADLIALYRGDFERAAKARLLQGDGSDLPTASFFMLDCGSGITPARLERLHGDPAAKIVGDLGNWFYENACPAWGADLGDDFRTGFTTDVPTVVVQGTWDVSTPFDNALELLPAFRNLHFIPVEGGSHGALEEALRSAAGFREALMKFVASGDATGLPAEVVLPDLEWVVPN